MRASYKVRQKIGRGAGGEIRWRGRSLRWNHRFSAVRNSSPPPFLRRGICRVFQWKGGGNHKLTQLLEYWSFYKLQYSFWFGQSWQWGERKWHSDIVKKVYWVKKEGGGLKNCGRRIEESERLITAPQPSVLWHLSPCRCLYVCRHFLDFTRFLFFLTSYSLSSCITPSTGFSYFISIIGLLISFPVLGLPIFLTVPDETLLLPVPRLPILLLVPRLPILLPVPSLPVLFPV